MLFTAIKGLLKNRSNKPICARRARPCLECSGIPDCARSLYMDRRQEPGLGQHRKLEFWRAEQTSGKGGHRENTDAHGNRGRTSSV